MYNDHREQRSYLAAVHRKATATPESQREAKPAQHKTHIQQNDLRVTHGVQLAAQGTGNAEANRSGHEKEHALSVYCFAFG